MEFLIEILKIAATVLTVALTQWVILKNKKMDVEVSKNKAIEDCQAKHKGDVERVKAEFNDRLDDISSDITDIKNESLRTSMSMGTMQNEIKEVKKATEKIYDLEKAVAIIQNTIGMQHG